MITRIELDGFKSFYQFGLDLNSFQVLVGSNGAGKSNLFDAFRLLARLASPHYSLEEALRGERGETEQLFTLDAANKPVKQMRLAVEILLNPIITDSLGQSVKLDYTRLRYELALRRGTDKLEIIHEDLRSIPPHNDSWLKQHTASGWLTPTLLAQPKIFISRAENEGKLSFKLAEKDNSKNYEAGQLETTILANTNRLKFAHVLAVQKELQDCKVVHLNPAELRRQENLNLPAMLRRMQSQDRYALNEVSTSLVNLLRGIVKVILIDDDIIIKAENGRLISWQTLSDGALRLLALTILVSNPDFNGLICIEEPENGINPANIKGLGHLLKRMATDFNEPSHANFPLGQVLVSTHSPLLISQAEIIQSVLFVYPTTLVRPSEEPLRITQIEPIKNEQPKLGHYTIDQIKDYLNGNEFESAIEFLESVYA